MAHPLGGICRKTLYFGNFNKILRKVIYMQIYYFRNQSKKEEITFYIAMLSVQKLINSLLN